MRYYPVLSVQQPWAWLITHGFKDCENRTWSSPITGPIWIHAGLTWDQDGWEWVTGGMDSVVSVGDLQRCEKEAMSQRGGIVGTANIVRCTRFHDSPWADPAQFKFVIDKAGVCEFVKCRGQLKFFEVEV